MSGRRGPVLVEIPRDVLNDQKVDLSLIAPARIATPLRCRRTRTRWRRRRLLVRRAERPLLLVGGGVTRAAAHELVVQLAERHGIPMITAYGRNDAVPNAHPLYLGPLGRAGAPEAAAACRHADVLLAIGTRLGQFTSHFDDRAIRPETALIHVDVDAREIGRHYPVAVGLQADARARLRRAGGAPGPRRRRHRPRAVAGGRGRAQAEAPLAARGGRRPRCAAAQAPARLRGAAEGAAADTIVTLDAGAAPAYGYDRLAFSRPRTFLTPLDLGGLGFAFPVALGAKLGRPEAPVLAIHGDGGYLMNVQELETAVRHRINAVTLVMNNNCWGSEKAYQRAYYGGRYIGCDIGNPRYDQLARLFGAEGYYVEAPDQIGDTIRAAFAADKPAVIEIPIRPDELPTPATAARRSGAVRGARTRSGDSRGRRPRPRSRP
jgi:acetolactate synthase-1/2/3 large subunit/sulfoacetaldehyde acetyltransferase